MVYSLLIDTIGKKAPVSLRSENTVMPAMTPVMQHDRLDNLKTSVVNDRLDDSIAFELEFWDVLSARAELPLGTSGGSDGTTDEVWREASLTLVVSICQLFRRRALAADKGEESKHWKQVEYFGIMKTPNAK